jgi:hypothetical protein
MEKRGTKLVFGNNVYYIKYDDQILGVVEKWKTLIMELECMNV